MNRKPNRSRFLRRADLIIGLSIPILMITPAEAYIDPGTGSALVYLMTGIVLSVYFGARGLYYRLSELVLRRRHKQQHCSLALHSESPRYESTFLPLLDELSRLGQEVTYLTMYERDETFIKLPEHVVHHSIAPGLLGYSYLNNLRAEMLVTTTPQLNVMTFRRGKGVKHYCHIPHALGESRYLRPYAYDYFDSVLCCGKFLKANLRRLESLRNLASKELYETGVPHYDAMLRSLVDYKTDRSANTSSVPTVLVAPSWGPLSIFECFGTDFITPLSAKFRVIVRPHPQMKISSHKLYEELLSLPNIEVSTDRSPDAALARADILISDISGIAHECAFIHEKPVIIIDQKQVEGGLEGEVLGGDSELKQRCREVVVPLPPSQIDTLVEQVEIVLSSYSRENLESVRQDVVYNFGHASKVAAHQIQEILKCL